MYSVYSTSQKVEKKITVSSTLGEIQPFVAASLHPISPFMRQHARPTVKDWFACVYGWCREGRDGGGAGRFNDGLNSYSPLYPKYNRPPERGKQNLGWSRRCGHEYTGSVWFTNDEI